MANEPDRQKRNSKFSDDKSENAVGKTSTSIQQKGAIKSGFNQFRVWTVSVAFFCLIDTWYNDSQFEAKIKSSRDSLRLKFNAHKKHQVAERERNECCSNFRQHFFSSSRLKADAREKQRDRTVKNPSEAFNLLLQQNFISTLIFFMREKGRQKCDRFKQSKQIFHVFVPSIPAFLFRHNENSFAYARRRNRSSETVPAEYCINTFYTNIMPDKYFLARCVTVVAAIALLLSFIDIVPRAGNAFSSKNSPSTRMWTKNNEIQ